MADSGNDRHCKLCGGVATSRHTAQPGYREGMFFEVLHCTGCDASFVDPMLVDPSIYDAIYSHAHSIPGYDRYSRYAREVAEAEEPLAHLAEAEDDYWSIRASLEGLSPAAAIIEIGSGLGYLTYALRKAGFDAIGMDISGVAVASATARFGPFYQEADLQDWSVRCAGAYDLVIMSELIEHVPDPAAMLQMAAQLLKPGGRLVITTPNKSNYPDWVLWETEAPPIHLWWFSETSMRVLAQQTGLEVSFVDFSPFNLKHPESPLPVMGRNQPTFGAMLDAANRPLSKKARRRADHQRRTGFYLLRKLKRSGLRRMHALRDWIRPAAPEQRRRILCAVMTKSQG